MFRVLALAISGVALIGCSLGLPSGAYSVDEVLADISSRESQLHGKTVAVEGWLGECGGLDCAIYPTLQDARLVANGDWDSEEWSAAMDRRLAIGGNIDFDLMAMPMQFSRVVVRGQINSQWKKPASETGFKPGCLDRCNDINPESIEAIIF